MGSPVLSLLSVQNVSPATAKLYYRNSDFAPLGRQEQSYMCNFNVTRDKELEVEQIEKKKKEQSVQLKLTLPEQFMK